jgi:23S rRNA (pseudouridine1915-N3)-methyltransferase
MQPIKIITIGKIKNQSLKLEIEDLMKRLRRVEIIELKEIKDSNTEIIKKKEFELIKPYLVQSSKKVLLWEHGKTYSTQKFYDTIKKIEQEIVFIITGAFGPSQELIDLADMKLSLSEMTFTHEQALYMLVEQIYRSDQLEKGSSYTK